MTFKKNLSISIVLASILFFSSSAFAVDVTVTAEAVIQTATLSLTPGDNLNFGTIVVADAGSIKIDASGGAATPAVLAGSVAVSGGGSGSFIINSNISAPVSIGYPTTAQNISESGGANMPITQVETNSSGTSANITAGTATTMHVGGVLTVANGQTAGNYTGTFTISVNYQ